MNDEQKEMTQEEAEQDFKDKMFDIFSEKLEGVHRDKDGFIVIPKTSIKKKDRHTEDRS